MSVLRNAARKNLPQAERREQILQAALRAFTRGGYDGTHVEHIVKEAGVGRGTFYLHFKSKHEVFEVLVDRMLAIFLAARPLSPAVSPRLASLAEAECLLRESYATVLGTLHEHRHLAHLLFTEAVGINKGFRKKLDKHYREWHKRACQSLDALVEQGIARRTLDVELTGEMILGMVERIARRYLFERADVDLKRFVDALVAFELHGIEATPPLIPRR